MTLSAPKVDFRSFEIAPQLLMLLLSLSSSSLLSLLLLLSRISSDLKSCAASLVAAETLGDRANERQPKLSLCFFLERNKVIHSKLEAS